jgi:phosphoribosyl 1,2-cyclic phosphodiesterase
VERVDVLITHLHMDHIQGLPFFAPLYDPDVRVDVWGPVSDHQTLQERLNRYLSPPLFPVRVRDLPNVVFHDVSPGVFDIDGVKVTADLVSHPGATLGFRLEEGGRVLTYLPDHEPALGAHDFPSVPEWTSGYELAHGADLLIHDSQYTDEEYAERVGWGHSSLTHLLGFVRLAEVARLVSFHHDPAHTDVMLDEVHRWLEENADEIEIVPGMTGTTINV